MRASPETEEDFLRQVFVVVVLYKRAPDASEALQSLASVALPAESILLYDNSLEPQPVDDPRIIYIHDASNSGVSKAYNEGHKLANERGKAWLLVCDQDMSLTTQYFTALFTALQQHGGSRVFVPELRDQRGPVSPFRWIFRRGKRITPGIGKMPLSKYRFLNSGMLISTDTFASAGMYDEHIPLDFSDIAFGEALLKATDHFVRIQATLTHKLFATGEMPVADALIRFRHFRGASARMGNLFGYSLLYDLHAFLRCIRLSLKFRTMDFIRIYFQE